MSFNISSLPSYFYGVHFSEHILANAHFVPLLCVIFICRTLSAKYIHVTIVALRQTQSTTKIFKCTCSKHEEFAKRFQTGCSVSGCTVPGFGTWNDARAVQEMSTRSFPAGAASMNVLICICSHCTCSFCHA